MKFSRVCLAGHVNAPVEANHCRFKHLVSAATEPDGLAARASYYCNATVYTMQTHQAETFAALLHLGMSMADRRTALHDFLAEMVFENVTGRPAP